MIRTVMLASAFALSAPAIAQDTPPADPATQAPEAAAPAAPADSATQAAPAENAAPAATQVAQVVDTDFPAYDKDKNGELSQEEFGEWMTKLRSATPGQATAEADTKAWAGAAFAQADTDKSKSVSKAELTTFLSG